MVNRRSFLKTAGLASLTGVAGYAAPPKLKITRVRAYAPPVPAHNIAQSNIIVTVETDGGITGIGEGGTKDLIEQCGGLVIGQDPLLTEKLWQLMWRGTFYPPGREKTHALGAIDLALWDIKGKVFDAPVHQLLGGLARNHIECYPTGFPSRGSVRETAKACMEAGYRCFRLGMADLPTFSVYNSHERVLKAFEECSAAREGVGRGGDWMIDVHTRLDLPDAVRLCTLLEPLAPYLVEDPLRSEAIDTYRPLRMQTKVPLGIGEQFGARWDMLKLIEDHLMDYNRATLPNVGGITEYLKIAAMCETHTVGMVPHFTGPVATVALTHVLGAYSGPVLMEYNEPRTPAPRAHLPQLLEFKNGKLWPNSRPGLGVTFDEKQARLIAEVTQPYNNIRHYLRPDGSLTNW